MRTKENTMNYVLDSWALLSYLQKEQPASKEVKSLFRAAIDGKGKLYISKLNLGEVYYIIARRRNKEYASELLEEVDSLPLNQVKISEEIFWQAMDFKVDYPLALADAFAAATTKSMDAKLVTGDPELLTVKEIPVKKLARN